MKQFLKIFLLFICFYSQSALAGPVTPDEEKKLKFIQTCKEDETIFRPWRITGNVVRCIEKVINTSADKLIDNYIAGFSTFVFYSTMIAVFFFSFKVMFGLARTRGLTIVYLLKIALVLSITSPGTGDYLKTVRDTMISAPKYFSVLLVNSVTFPIQGLSEDKVNEDIFDVFDKYILKFFGVDEADQKFEKGTADKTASDRAKERTKEVYIGIAAVVAGLFFTGQVGFTITTIALGFVTALLFAIAQAVLFYATITVALNFLIAISPIAAVAFLFEPFKRITSVWFTSFIGYAVQPVIFVAFLALTLSVLDQTVASFENPYQKIQMKLLNADGDPGKEVPLFKCGKFQDSPEAQAENMNDPDNQESNMASEQLGTMGNLAYQAGVGSYSQTKTSNASSRSSTCRFTVPQLPLDENLTESDIRDLQGGQMVVILMMIIMLGFLKQVPTIMNSITGKAVVQPVSGGIDTHGGINESPLNAARKLGEGGTSAIRSLFTR